jgi:hypothetical protein
MLLLTTHALLGFIHGHWVLYSRLLGCIHGCWAVFTVVGLYWRLLVCIGGRWALYLSSLGWIRAFGFCVFTVVGLYSQLRGCIRSWGIFLQSLGVGFVVVGLDSYL